jgi:protein-tyrosine phosphatase
MNASRITDHLYVSTELKDQDIQVVQELDVRLVIGMIAHIRPPRRLAELPVEVVWLRTFDFFLLPIPLRTLYRGVEAALPVIQQGDSVLVYCQAGRHRSVAMASTILIGLGHSADEAMELIVERRPVADPWAWHIQRQIRRFEKYWQRGQSLEQDAANG